VRKRAVKVLKQLLALL